MKAARNLLIGIVLGAAIGWFLGFLRLPYVEKNAYFLLGFAACVVLILLVLVLLIVWNKHSLLLRLIGNTPAKEDSKSATRRK